MKHSLMNPYVLSVVVVLIRSHIPVEHKSLEDSEFSDECLAFPRTLVHGRH